MEVLRVTGGRRLMGRIAISGSKNAALPAMAASLLTPDPVELVNVPEIEDIDTMAEMLRHVGVEVTPLGGSTWRLHARSVTSASIGADLTRRLRGSLLLLGAMVARSREASIARPGGDDIGMRRAEQHLEGLRAMGAEVVEDADSYIARADRLRGARIDLDMPTVTGTENLMMAAVTAEGITVIANAAREPHVVDLARCLNGMGARITGAGSELIVIEGVGGLLHGTRHSVTTDYVEAGTYMVAAAATGGDVVVERMRPADIRFLLKKLRAAGCEAVEGAGEVRVHGSMPLHPVDVTTWPHPGFATDLQAQFVALMTLADGVSVISEALFENRFRHAAELARLGARISVEGRSAVITGPARLRGTAVRVPDIRSGAALVIAALAAEGTSVLRDVYHLDRGYENLVAKLRGLGADVEREVLADGAVQTRDFSGVIGD